MAAYWYSMIVSAGLLKAVVYQAKLFETKAVKQSCAHFSLKVY